VKKTPAITKPESHIETSVHTDYPVRDIEKRSGSRIAVSLTIALADIIGSAALVWRTVSWPGHVEALGLLLYVGLPEKTYNSISTKSL
jgi:hypothetical protein